MNKPNTYLLVVLTAGLLAACGGGGGNDGPADPPATPSGSVPPSAWASIVAYVSYVGSLVATETGTPLNVDDVNPPTSETALPLPVN